MPIPSPFLRFDLRTSRPILIGFAVSLVFARLATRTTPACADEPPEFSPPIDEHCATPACCPSGSQIIQGSAVPDMLTPAVADTCTLGLDGGDLIVPGPGASGSLVVFAGDANDQIHAPPVAAQLLGQGGPDNIYGSAYDDQMHGGTGGDQLYGRAGHDLCIGGEGPDLIYGGPGNDDLWGSSGDDQIWGDFDNLGNIASDDRIHGGPGDDRIRGDGGHDEIYGDAGADWIDAGDGNDRVVGGDGDDELLGRNGHDVLKGGAGNDRLDGGFGNDELHPAEGADLVFGGPGDDVVVLLDECEAAAGLHIDGGPGHDILRSPLSPAHLVDLGVRIENIETYEFVPAAGNADCSRPDPGSLADIGLSNDPACALLEKTAIVVEGRVTALRESHDEVPGAGPWTTHTLEQVVVHEGELGRADGPIPLRMTKGTVPGGDYVSDAEAVELLAGERYLMFMWSAAWRYSPIIGHRVYRVADYEDREVLVDQSGRIVAGIMGFTLPGGAPFLPDAQGGGPNPDYVGPPIGLDFALDVGEFAARVNEVTSRCTAPILRRSPAWYPRTHANGEVPTARAD